MEKIEIDINCDLGEGVDNESELMPFISSCNIACGGHAGNEDTMRKTILLALKHNVKIGAHPSYPDKENFGRKVIDISPKRLQQSIEEQLNFFDGVLKEEGVSLHHIKPHGALYNQIAKDKNSAQVFLSAIVNFKSVFLYAPYGSEIAKQANSSGFRVKYEAFGDRNYNDDLSLVSRKQDNALITDPEQVMYHIIRMVKKDVVRTIKNQDILIGAETFCVHGDTPSALKILMYLHQELPKYQLKIA